MKLFPNRRSDPRRTSISAFTLVEMMMSVWIYLFIFVGVMVAIQIFALRIYALTATKLSATASAMKTLDQIRDTIREATTLQVGNWTNNSFVAIPASGKAQGNALQIYPSGSTLPCITFYLDKSTSTYSLKEYTVTGTGSTTTTVASYITNAIIFDAEDYQGDIVSNNPVENQVFRMTLQFDQWEYPIANTGKNQYGFYQLRTLVCRRASGID